MKQDEIKELLERYINGDTTNAEEEQLRSYFSQTTDPLPEEWTVFRALFCYETHERQMIVHNATTTAEKAPRRKSTMKTYMSLVASVAAVVVLLVSLFIWNTHSETQNNEKQYMVTNGIKVTNSDDINKEVDKVLALLANDNDKAFSALEIINQHQ